MDLSNGIGKDVYTRLASLLAREFGDIRLRYCE